MEALQNIQITFVLFFLLSNEMRKVSFLDAVSDKCVCVCYIENVNAIETHSSPWLRFDKVFHRHQEGERAHLC